MRFLFYSNDHEPVHVHVSNGSYDAKFMVGPDIKLIKNKEVITSRWQEFFN